MIKVNMWESHKKSKADQIQWTFYPNDREYRGNLLNDGDYIGDFVADNYTEMMDHFNYIFEKA